MASAARDRADLQLPMTVQHLLLATERALNSRACVHPRNPPGGAMRASVRAVHVDTRAQALPPKRERVCRRCVSCAVAEPSCGATTTGAATPPSLPQVKQRPTCRFPEPSALQAPPRIAGQLSPALRIEAARPDAGAEPERAPGAWLLPRGRGPRRTCAPCGPALSRALRPASGMAEHPRRQPVPVPGPDRLKGRGCRPGPRQKQRHPRLPALPCALEAVATTGARSRPPPQALLRAKQPPVRREWTRCRSCGARSGT